ncbi:MAG TPA: SAM-dependent methyltransferase [Bacteroidales bacterium]|nr:SAM-dependent methyltransferase [Bacteroidales bacterium]
MKRLMKLILNTIPRPWLIRLSYIFRRFSRLYYRGSNFECPVCQATYRKFLPYGYVHSRDNAMCPGCLSLERHRLMWLYLNEKTNFFKENLKVLHVAPEQCFHGKFKHYRNLDYKTADLESPLADYKCDIQNMPFENESFDVVICNHVLEHVPDDKKAMKEIQRILKPKGYAILQVPADFSRKETFEDNSIKDKKERTRIFGQYDHVRVYGTDYPERLRNSGFIIDESNYLDDIPQDEKDKYSLNFKEFMFSSKKE